MQRSSTQSSIQLNFKIN